MMNALYFTAMSIWGEYVQKATLKNTDPALYNFLLELEHERAEGQVNKSQTRESEAMHQQLRLRQSQRLKMTNLCQMRRQKHMTQANLSRASGISSRTITAIENGRNIPSVFVALALAAALDSSVEELFYISPPDQPVDDFTTGRAMHMKR